tara:strand:+ start:804 stop:1034 length:231 start_codon:yes stop_codon:yes gene_type:complete
MVTLKFKVTEISLVNNIIHVGPSTILYSWNEIQNKIQVVFPNQKTYQTKEEGSLESLIKSTTDETTLLHILNLDNT